MLQLSLNGCPFVLFIHAEPQHISQSRHHLANGLLMRRLCLPLNGIERVIEKMRVDLVNQHALLKLLLLGFNLFRRLQETLHPLNHRVKATYHLPDFILLRSKFREIEQSPKLNLSHVADNLLDWRGELANNEE
ncbi:hypothetical protein D3C87_1734000 [compost metagenome]